MRNLILFSLLIIYQGLSAQRQPQIDFSSANIAIQIDSTTRKITGEARYQFKALARTDSVFLDAIDMEFESVRLNGKKVKVVNNGKKLLLFKKFKAGESYLLELRYVAQPKQTVYFIGWDDKLRHNNQIWTQGQGKYTSHWVPSFDDMNEKLVFKLRITFDSTYEVVANGRLQNIRTSNGLKTWSFAMEKPMSSYLLAFAIGNYEKSSIHTPSGVPLELYYYPEDSLKVEPTYRYTEKIFNFLEKEIGVPYPWQNYKQIPVRDFLYAGMENTGTTIFSDGFVIDSTAFDDKNYVNINAHELAHQWFGNMVTEQSGKHHWLHEGFATYYAYLAEKTIFGDDYFYWRLYDTAKQLEDLEQDDGGDALINPGAGSLTFYEKGAWALHMLKENIGQKAFKQGIINYLERYRFKNVTISGFFEEIENVSGKDLSKYRYEWIEGDNFPFQEAMENLSSSCPPISEFLKLKRELTTSSENDEDIIRRYWENTNSEELKSRIISYYYKSLSPEFIIKAFKTNDLKIRRALAQKIMVISPEIKEAYVGLLRDESYITVENALYQLWISFPEERHLFLEQTKSLIGLPNKNVRLLWLLLAVLTKDYLNDGQKQQYTNELVSYTSPMYGYEVRQNAFALLSEVQGLTDENLKDLINASVHHYWRFRNYARTLLDKLLKDDKQKQRLQQLARELNERELGYIRDKFETK